MHGTPPSGSETRLPYTAPELRDHGTVEELTLAGGSDPEFDGEGYAGPTTPTS